MVIAPTISAQLGELAAVVDAAFAGAAEAPPD